MFFVDIIATVPLYEFSCVVFKDNITEYVQLFSMLKLVRFSRVHRIITFWNTTDDVKLSLQLLKTTL